MYDGYYIDNLSIALDCVAPTGGLVVGNVYDDNTNAPLVGALVANEDGGSTLTVVTPDDPAVNDGFMFSMLMIARTSPLRWMEVMSRILLL